MLVKLVLLPLLVMLSAQPLTIDAVNTQPVVISMDANHIDALWNPAESLPYEEIHESADSIAPGDGLVVRGSIDGHQFVLAVVGGERGHVWFVTEGRVDHSPYFRPIEAIRFAEQMVRFGPDNKPR